MHPSPAQDHRTAQDTSTALQVPPSADLVIAPTPQDRALVPSEHAPCACPRPSSPSPATTTAAQTGPEHPRRSTAADGYTSALFGRSPTYMPIGLPGTPTTTAL